MHTLVGPFLFIYFIFQLLIFFSNIPYDIDFVETVSDILLCAFPEMYKNLY